MRATPNRAARFLFRKKDDTNVVARNSMCYNCLAVFRVVVSLTLKTVNYLIFSYLRSTPYVRYLLFNCGNIFCALTSLSVFVVVDGVELLHCGKNGFGHELFHVG